MPEKRDDADWTRWGVHVLAELERLNLGLKDIDARQENRIESLRREINDLTIKVSTDITMLKVKSGLWGGIVGLVGGAIPVAIGIAMWLIKG